MRLDDHLVETEDAFPFKSLIQHIPVIQEEFCQMMVNCTGFQVPFAWDIIHKVVKRNQPG